MNHFATAEFWFHYRNLPEKVRSQADKNFKLLQINPRHPSLHLKKINMFWSVRVGLSYRALAKERDEGLVWFWIGSHERYNWLIEL